MVLPKVLSPSRVYLYGGEGSKPLNLDEIADYLKKKVRDIKIVLRDEFFSYHLSLLALDKKEAETGDLALRLARIKIQELSTRKANDPLFGEIEYEKKQLLSTQRKPIGILYDGFALQVICSEMLCSREGGRGNIHIAFTNQLIGTWDTDDLRYHARVAVYGFPCIISTTGLVEAPAKPREFYLKKNLGINPITLKKEFAGRFIDYNDPRTTDIIKGYVMQALFYQLTGNPFCEDSNCRLYNGHWQEEVIRAQIGGGREFCERHEELLACVGKDE